MFDLYTETLMCLEKSREGLNYNKFAFDMTRAKKSGVNLFTLAIPSLYWDDKKNLRNFRNLIRYFDVLMDPVEMQEKLSILNNGIQAKSALEDGKTLVMLQAQGGVFSKTLYELEEIYNKGVRSVSLVHAYGNHLASAIMDEKITDTGLTDAGKGLIQELNLNHMLLDLSGLSEKSFYEALNISKIPAYVSHTNLLERKNHPLNITNAQLKEVVNSGGIVGLSFMKELIGFEKNIVESYLYMLASAVDMVGLSGLAVGSGFDAGPTLFSDVSNISSLKEAMINFGFYPEEADAILEGNAKKYLLKNLT